MRFTVTAGHGGSDPGNTAGGYREAELMDELGHLVALQLRASGHEVLQDGERGENWPLERALRLIKGVDLAVELHTNAVNNHRATGVEVIAAAIRRREAQRLAGAISEVLGLPLRKQGGWYDADQHGRDRGWERPAAFVRYGGLIVETFFQSNPHELARYLVLREQVAAAIARALVASVETRV